MKPEYRKWPKGEDGKTGKSTTGPSEMAISAAGLTSRGS
jgi:hypothetical protein